jgi:hypothetical protein
MEEPTHNGILPVIAAGAAFTVIVILVVQPSQVVNTIVETPAATPVTVPSVPMVATVVLLLLHVPHVDDVLNIVEAPTHSVPEPVIVPAAGFTVNTAYDWQPVDTVYVISVVPAVKPITTPDVEPMVATVVLLLLHETPPVEPVNVVEEPSHRDNEPLIADGSELTVIDFVR